MIAQRSLMLAWWLWFTAIVAILVAALMLAGCAPAPRVIPECEEIEGHMMVTPAGPLFFFDEDAMRKLDARQRMLQRGECRLEP